MKIVLTNKVKEFVVPHLQKIPRTALQQYELSLTIHNKKECMIILKLNSNEEQDRGFVISDEAASLLLRFIQRWLDKNKAKKKVDQPEG